MHHQARIFFPTMILWLLVLLFSPASALVNAAYSADQNLALAETLYHSGVYEEAVGYYREMVEALPQNPADQAEAMFLKARLATCLVILCDFGQANKLYSTFFEVPDQNLTENHQVFALALRDLAAVYGVMDEPDKGARLLELALHILQNVLPPRSPETIRTETLLADSLVVLGDPAQAEAHYQAALSNTESTQDPGPKAALQLPILLGLIEITGRGNRIRDMQRHADYYVRRLGALYGSDSPDLWNGLLHLSNLYLAAGQTQAATDCLAALLESISQAGHADREIHVRALLSSAALKQQLGDYQAANAELKTGFQMAESLLSPIDDLLIDATVALADSERDLGNYARAQELYTSVVSRAAGDQGLSPELRIKILKESASFYGSICDTAQAERLLLQALSLVESTYGQKNLKMADCLMDLGSIYQYDGDNRKSLSCRRRAHAILSELLGPDHVHTALALAGVGEADLAMGDAPSAVPILEKARQVVAARKGPDHPDTLRVEKLLGEAMGSAGEKNRARLVLAGLLPRSKTVYGEDHPLVAEAADSLAQVQAMLNHDQEALDLMRQVQAIDTRIIREVLGFTSQEQKIAYIGRKIDSLHRLMSLAVLHADAHEYVEEAFNSWVRRKGLILEADKQYQEAIYYSDDPEVLSILQNLRYLSNELSKLAFQDLGKSNLDANRRTRESLLKRQRALEGALREKSRRFAEMDSARSASAESLARALPKDTAMVEYARVRCYPFHQMTGFNDQSEERYLAFVLHSGDSDGISLVNVGHAAAIDDAVRELKKNIALLNREGPLPLPDQPSSQPSGEASLALKMRERCLDSARKLYQLAFEPLEPALEGIAELFLSPDGVLNLVPFEVLHDGQCYLVERYLFNYLSMGRDILSWNTEEQARSSAVLFGNPDFDLGLNQKEQTLDRLGIKPDPAAVPTREIRVSGLNLFSPLPGTEKEVVNIQKIIDSPDTQVYLEDEALEEVLFQSQAPRILHLATHGFFLDTAPAAQDRLGINLDILNRSGLALAGANQVLSGASDGGSIVTAAEVMNLDLRGTELVVLSACNTGLGVIVSGEGVFGLNRAFLEAGARSLIMSMWSVPDLETEELMVRFYEIVQAGQKNRCRALHQSMIDQIGLTRQRFGWAPPNLWGAFVFQGNPN